MGAAAKRHLRDLLNGIVMADAPERPLSPHLQIYRPQITSVMSIIHRATGIVLSLGALFMVIWLILAASGENAFLLAQSIAGSWIGYIFLFGTFLLNRLG